LKKEEDSTPVTTVIGKITDITIQIEELDYSILNPPLEL
jgi:hypothetical protein